MAIKWTAEELAEMRRADAEIEAEFRLTQGEIEQSRREDKAARWDAMDADKRKAAAYHKAYYEANREKVAATQKAYYEANREKVAATQRFLADSRRALGYTQRDVAVRLMVSPSAICRLEKGELLLNTFREKGKLLALLGVSEC